MLRLKPRQREMLADKLPDLANLGVGFLVLGQFTGPQPFSARLLLTGLAMWAVLIALALTLSGGKQ
jgi:hypothetical protein